MKKYQLIIFDWDGTLMDSTARIVSAMRTSANNIGLPVPEKNAVKNIIGLSLKEAFFELFGELEQKKYDAMLEEYRYQYVEGDQTATPLFNNSEKVITTLKQQGYLTAVATGKARPGLTRVLKATELESFFDFSCCADEAKSKPHPEMLQKIMQQAKLNPQDCLMIGDTTFDLEMANNAGMDCLGADFGAHHPERLLPLKPLGILSDIEEVFGYLG